ncbi:MAG: RDD family protein [Deltaproteobacteria bacterium]|nr:RDD family protein [Deltaproteobacteria bacterium]
MTELGLNTRLGEDDIRQALFIKRSIAKFIDLLITSALYVYHPLVGPLSAITYILISDGLKGGKSLGKRIAGLNVISTSREGRLCNFIDSIKRNSPFGAIVAVDFVFGWIPYAGIAIVFLFAGAVLAYEAMLAYNDPKGLRIGDRIADTEVVEDIGEGV